MVRRSSRGGRNGQSEQSIRGEGGRGVEGRAGSWAREGKERGGGQPSSCVPLGSRRPHLQDDPWGGGLTVRSRRGAEGDAEGMICVAHQGARIFGWPQRWRWPRSPDGTSNKCSISGGHATSLLRERGAAQREGQGQQRVKTGGAGPAEHSAILAGRGTVWPVSRTGSRMPNSA